MNQMSHEDCTKKIIAKINGELDAEENTLFDIHVLSCPKCSQVLRKYELLSRRLHRIEPDVVVPPLPPALLAIKQEIAQAAKEHLLEKAIANSSRGSIAEFKDTQFAPPSHLEKAKEEKLADEEALVQRIGQGDDEKLADEEALVRRVGQGDSVAFVKLYQNYVGPIYRFCYAQLGNISEAEDCTSETFTRAIEALSHGRYTWQGKPFGAWLFGIAIRVLRENNRKLKQAPIIERLEYLLEYNEPESESDALDALLHQEELDLLWQLIKDLNKNEQRILVLRHGYGLSYAEIAKRVGSSEGACKQAHYRILQKLRLLDRETPLWSEANGAKEASEENEKDNT